VKKNTVYLLLILAAIMCINTMSVYAGLSTESAWPTLRGDILNTGRSANIGPQNPVVLTNVDFGYNMPHSGVVLAKDGTAYFISGDRGDFPGKIHAISPEGEILWTIETGISGGAAQGSGAIAEDGTLYFQAGTKLYSIQPDGKITWTFEMGYGAINQCSPTVGPDGTIYINGGDSGNGNYALVAVTPDGTEKWRFKIWSQPRGSAVIGEDGVIYTAAHRRIYAINPDGTKKWECEDTGNFSHIVMLDEQGNSYIGIIPNMVMSFDPQGNRRWFCLLPGGITDLESKPALSPDGNTLYIGSWGDGLRFHAIDTSTGKINWNMDLGGGVRASASVDAEGTIYIGHGKKVYAINPNGTIKWDIEIPVGGLNFTSLAIGNNKMIYGLTVEGFFVIGEAD
jgi:outer membrane protein assembly factor BamB